MRQDKTSHSFIFMAINKMNDKKSEIIYQQKSLADS